MPEFRFTPGEIGLPSYMTQNIARFVELIVTWDYCEKKGGCSWYGTPGLQRDFADDPPTGTHRCKHLANFLNTQHPKIDRQTIEQFCLARKAPIDPGDAPEASFPVPDIISNDVERGLYEVYEVKPNNPTQIAAGLLKLTNFVSLSDFLRESAADPSIKYRAGTNYIPQLFGQSPPAIKLTFIDRIWNGLPCRLSLVIRRHTVGSPIGAGLIVYEFLLEVMTKEIVAEWFLRAAAVALLMLMVYAYIRFAPITVPITVPMLGPWVSPLFGSVGTNGTNYSKDVVYIQKLLNDFRTANSDPLIQIDGKSGPQTTGAITDWQGILGSEENGRVEPGSSTVRILETTNIERVSSYIELNDLQGRPEVAKALTQTEDDDVDGFMNLTFLPLVSDSVEKYFAALHEQEIS